MADARVIAAYTTLNAALTSGGSSFTCPSGEGARCPTSGIAYLWNSNWLTFSRAYQNGEGEAILCTRSSDTFTVVTRAYLDPQSKGAKAFAATTTRIEFNTPMASATASGDMDTGAQSFGGLKTFEAGIAVGKADTTDGFIRIYEANANRIDIVPAASLAANRTITIPDRDMTLAGNGDGIISFSGGASTLSSGATNYLTPSAGALYATSGDQRYYFRAAGTIANLHVWGTGNTNITGLVFTMMKGSGAAASSATLMTATIDPNGGYVYGSDTSNVISISANDWIELRVVSSGGGFAASGIGASVDFIKS